MTSSYNPGLARKEWGWRRFGRRFGISVLLTRGRWLGLRPRLFHDGPRVFIASLHFGFGELWLRFPVGPTPLRPDWPGRPTRAALLRPQGLRERFGSFVGRSLLVRYDRELGAETLRSDGITDEVVKARRIA